MEKLISGGSHLEQTTARKEKGPVMFSDEYRRRKSKEEKGKRAKEAKEQRRRSSGKLRRGLFVAPDTRAEERCS